MSKNLRTAIHAVDYTVGGEGRLVNPGETFDVPDTDVKFFDGIGAVREPTEEEKSAYEDANPKGTKADEKTPVGPTPSKTDDRPTI